VGGAASGGPIAPQPSGGSFLGTAAAAAAGVIGGGLLLNGIRNMLGGYQHHGPFAGAFDEIASGGSRSGGAENSELAREAFDAGEQGDERTTGLYDPADEAELDDSDADDVDGGSDDTGYA
jgi:hypothetical protein